MTTFNSYHFPVNGLAGVKLGGLDHNGMTYLNS